MHVKNQNDKNKNIILKRENNKLSENETSLNDIRKMNSMSLSKYESKTLKLNKDIIHLLESNNIQTLEENSKTSFTNDNKIDTLPHIKLSKLLFSTSTLNETSPINTFDRKNKNESILVSSEKEKEKKDNFFISECQISDKKKEKSKIINYKVSTPNYKSLNKSKLIKRNSSNVINEIANEEKKVNYVTKISVIKTINKKSSQKRANFRLKNLAKNMELFKHKKLNSNVITKSDQNKTNKNEINKSLSKENKKNSNKKNKLFNINRSLSKLDKLYMHIKLQFEKSLNKENNQKGEQKKKNINNSIKKIIFFYHDLFLKKQRLRTLKKIKLKSKIMNDFQNDSSMLLKNEINLDSNEKALYNLSLKDINNEKATLTKENEEKIYRKIRVLKRTMPRKEMSKKHFLDKIFLLDNASKNDFFPYNNQLDSLYRKERIDLYSI